MAKGKNVAPRVAATLAMNPSAFFAGLQKAAEAGEIMKIADDRQKIRLSEVGDFIVGKLVEIREGGKNKKDGKQFRVYYFDGVDANERGYATGSFDLDSKLTGDRVGQWLAIRLAELVDTGAESKMKRFDVYVLPEAPTAGGWLAGEDESELPF